MKMQQIVIVTVIDVIANLLCATQFAVIGWNQKTFQRKWNNRKEREKKRIAYASEIWN